MVPRRALKYYVNALLSCLQLFSLLCLLSLSKGEGSCLPGGGTGYGMSGWIFKLLDLESLFGKGCLGFQYH